MGVGKVMMKSGCNKVFTVAVFAVSVLVLLFFTSCIEAEEPGPIVQNYPVQGVWQAKATWHEENPYNYGGDTYVLEIYYDFQEQGVVKNRMTLELNDYQLSDSGWITLNLTWNVEGNVIKLSSGKQFVIADDCFNDIYPNPEMVLYFYKFQ